MGTPHHTTPLRFYEFFQEINKMLFSRNLLCAGIILISHGVYATQSNGRLQCTDAQKIEASNFDYVKTAMKREAQIASLIADSEARIDRLLREEQKAAKQNADDTTARGVKRKAIS